MGSDGHIVSVVIPTVGRPTLAGTRAALAAQTRPPDEVVVSRDEARRGISWARNEGIRRSRGDLVAFTDDDALPPPDWLERLIDAIDRHGAAGAGGNFAETDDLLRRKSARRGWPDGETADTSGWVGNGGNVMYRRESLDACRRPDGTVFDESFEFNCGEDHDLAARVRGNGGTLVYVPNAVTHLRKTTPLGYLAFQFRRGRGIAQLYRAVRAAGGRAAPGRNSLLWGRDGGGGARWGAALLKKAVGPFDVARFAGPGQFALFWLGEKLEGAGFLYEMARLRIRGAAPGAGGGAR